VILGGCLRGIVALLVVAAIAVGAFLYRDRLRTAWHDLRGARPQIEVASPELADQAARKLDELRAGNRGYIALSATELASLLAYRYQGVIPAFLHEPAVELHGGDRIRLRARVPVDMLPGLDLLGTVATFLPDTTELALSGRLLPLQPGRAAFAIDDVSAQRFPLPQRLVPAALERLGRRDEPGLPREALPLPLPPGASSAYVRGDSLVLMGTGGTGGGGGPGGTGGAGGGAGGAGS
jgi:hypothetical protein